MKIGELEVENTIINLEYKMEILEQTLNYILTKNNGIQGPSQAAIDLFASKSLKMIQDKYPSMGITKS